MASVESFTSEVMKQQNNCVKQLVLVRTNGIFRGYASSISYHTCEDGGKLKYIVAKDQP